jgi:hypothetical protein
MKRKQPTKKTEPQADIRPPEAQPEPADEQNVANRMEAAGQSVDPQARLLAREQERQDREAAMDEYLAEQQAKLNRMAQLRAQRLAKETDNKRKRLGS